MLCNLAHVCQPESLFKTPASPGDASNCSLSEDDRPKMRAALKRWRHSRKKSLVRKCCCALDTCKIVESARHGQCSKILLPHLTLWYPIHVLLSWLSLCQLSCPIYKKLNERQPWQFVESVGLTTYLCILRNSFSDNKAHVYISCTVLWPAKPKPVFKLCCINCEGQRSVRPRQLTVVYHLEADFNSQTNRSGLQHTPPHPRQREPVIISGSLYEEMILFLFCQSESTSSMGQRTYQALRVLSVALVCPCKLARSDCCFQCRPGDLYGRSNRCQVLQLRTQSGNMSGGIMSLVKKNHCGHFPNDCGRHETPV